MRRTALFLLLLAALLPGGLAAAQHRTTLNLSGVWEFDQTREAFPPRRFTRTIPVPGLIFLASPRIEQWEAYYDGSYEPRYNWYRKRFTVPAELEGSRAMVTLLKSMFVTQVFLNGIELGQSMAAYTPVEFPAGAAIRYGAENELLVRVDDRQRLPAQAAGSTDKEKVTYWPGIWDEVFVSFTGDFRVNRSLLLPDLGAGKVTARLQLRSFLPSQLQYGDTMWDSAQVEVRVREKRSGKAIGATVTARVGIKRENLTVADLELPLPAFRPWTPDDPFLYTATIILRGADGLASDSTEATFGMRSFGRNGKHFTLNGEEIILRGTNITLHRFFEDPECAALPWDRQWVRKLLQEIPDRLDWNAMRICVGIAPSFWYEIADEAGLLLQNEWLYWQNHGWDDQLRAEYTDWVWTDGNHPGIAIWDAINENWDPYIGNTLIPELKALDPTRIWDAGYMTSEHMQLDEMDEPHPYTVFGQRENFAQHMERQPHPLGDLHYWPENHRSFLTASSAQLVNEYGWIWLWRDGRPAHLTHNNFDYYVGRDATPEQRFELQAYWVQCETEWLRTERSFAGVLAFCYLTDNFGFTGDWWLDPVAKLDPAPALKWMRHAFAPAAVFIDLVDERYLKHLPPRAPGSRVDFALVGVNDLKAPVRGQVSVRLLDADGRERSRQEHEILIPGYLKEYLAASLELPAEPGGYLLLAEFTPADGPRAGRPVLSRRYLKVGPAARYDWYEADPGWDR